MKNLFFLLCFLIGATLMSCAPKASDEAPAEAAADTTKAPAPVEFADAKYSEIARKAQAALSAGDVAAWTASYADNAVYRWNNGDSLAGKKAIHDYWVDRRSKLIDSLTMSEQIFLPVQVNTPQSNERTGVWLLSWYRVDAKYKTGKKMTQWMHAVMHFDANDKIDEVIQYRDNAPIIAATMK